MSKFDFDTITDRSNSYAIKYDLAEKRNKPLDAISLWVADMDFKTAPCIQKALAEKAAHGIFGYSRPDSRYYNALRNWFLTEHNFEIKDEWVVNTPGVVYAFATAIRALTEEGDAVLVTRPVYYPFSSVINNQNRKLVNSALVLKNGHYEIDFEDFENKIISEKVKVFLFCSPHNPGGRVWAKEELKKISEICLKHNVIVVSDEIHCDITFENHKHTVFASISDEARENSIICTAPSKTFNLAGLQFSNIIIANEKLRAKFTKEMDRTGYDEPSLMGIVAATAAYSEGKEWFEAAKAYIWNNILFAEKLVNEKCPKIKVLKPEGSYLLWLDFSAFDLSDSQINDRVLNKAKVWIDGGIMFGPEGEKFQRINCATPRAILEKALTQICNEFSEE
ncbi:MAG: pyridoxal phosphate-dependent aminotransferase [Treponema sp.]|uniref:MalY/PatB family protein n=1 Tax=Treponema sp. TaxID=166 RepID=UPI00298E97FE|nr:MalY/PatB family protein [Treponema sp.]MCQ2601764.1 pyridoxal phosphate-dependent aminotransferase [Treponema sp.]